jgi:hypothetical protein
MVRGAGEGAAVADQFQSSRRTTPLFAEISMDPPVEVKFPVVVILAGEAPPMSIRIGPRSA